jgi:hypothetical protein
MSAIAQEAGIQRLSVSADFQINGQSRIPVSNPRFNLDAHA